MSPRQPRDMTAQEITQATRLLRALKRAIEGLEKLSGKEMLDRGIEEKERVGAIAALRTAVTQLEEPSKNRYDLGTSVFVGHLDSAIKSKVAEVLRGNALSWLSLFGHRSAGRVQATFAAAGIPVPLLFASFHAAYQEEIRALRTSRPSSMVGSDFSVNIADMA